jgi:hypothetical protein
VQNLSEKESSNPKVIAGAPRLRTERPEAALYRPQKLTDVLSLWNSSNFTPG